MLTESSNLSDHDDNDTLSIHLSAIENLSLLDDDNGKDDILGDNNINNDDLDLRYWKSWGLLLILSDLLKDFISRAPPLRIDPPNREARRETPKKKSNKIIMKRMKELKDDDKSDKITAIKELKRRIEGIEDHLSSMDKKLENSLREQKNMIESFIASMSKINNQPIAPSNHHSVNHPNTVNNSSNNNPLQSKVDFHMNSIMSTANDADKLIKILAESPELGGNEQPLPSNDLTERYKLLKKRLLAANMKLIQLELDKITTLNPN